MKRVIALVLSCALVFVGCGHNTTSTDNHSVEETQVEVMENVVDEGIAVETTQDMEDATPYEYVVDFNSLDDAELQRYVQDNIYNELVAQLDSDEYFVENVSAVYISQEYIDELTYNSRPNVYFGYTLEEINAVYQGTRYVFTMSEEGDTIVVPFEEYDDTFEQVIKDVAIGTGVILICVTVSVVSAGAGAPAVSMIFAASAKSGTIFALSSGGLSAVASGVVTGIETGDMDEALKAAAISGSESFKWGAITGVISGGTTEAVALKGATLNELTMNEAAIIQKESGFPLDVIKQFRNMEQYNICKDAGLTSKLVNGKTALVRNIDLNYVDDATGLTNLELMSQGYAPIEPATGAKYQLHHIGQKADSTLAILTETEHKKGGNDAIWHLKDIATEVHTSTNNWDAQRKQFWKAMAYIFENGGV